MLLFIDNKLFLSYDFLKNHGVNSRSIENWPRRNEVNILKVEGKYYIEYNSIPAPTRAKLPKESELLIIYQDQQKGGLVTSIYEKLKYAQTRKFDGYQKIYRNEYGLDTKKAFEKAMKAAVWEKLLKIRSEYLTGNKGGVQKGMAEVLRKAYLRIYPGKLDSDAAFSRAINEATTKGVTGYCVDGRLLKNRDKPANQQYDERHITVLCGLFAPGKKNRAPQILRQMQRACEELDIKCPQLSWVKKNMAGIELNPSLYKNRYGVLATDHIIPTMDLLPASYAGNQFQVDGFVMPFLYQHKDKDGKISYKRPVLTAVFDNHSKKIVGYSVGISESREALLQAFEETVKNTGGLAYEIVSDNHSFNQTKEVINFKELIAALGIVWTVTSNPRQKIVAESSFKFISESHCKQYGGYLGLDIKTKGKNSRPSQEEIDVYLKADNRLSYEEIKGIAIAIVESWNNEKAPGRDNTPNKLWHNSKKPHLRTIDEMDRMRLFTRSTTYKISKYQVSMLISGIKYNYQLSIDYDQYNGKEVIVRYVTFDEVFLFDPKNDSFICCVKQKPKAHSALIDQTPADIDIYHKQTAFAKAVMQRSEKRIIDTVDKAETMLPGIRNYMNEFTTPKSIMQVGQEDIDLQMVMRLQGVDPNKLPSKPAVSGITHIAFKEPERRKKEKSPYHDENHQISIISED